MDGVSPCLFSTQVSPPSSERPCTADMPMHSSVSVLLHVELASLAGARAPLSFPAKGGCLRGLFVWSCRRQRTGLGILSAPLGLLPKYGPSKLHSRGFEACCLCRTRPVPSKCCRTAIADGHQAIGRHCCTCGRLSTPLTALPIDMITMYRMSGMEVSTRWCGVRFQPCKLPRRCRAILEVMLRTYPCFCRPARWLTALL